MPVLKSQDGLPVLDTSKPFSNKKLQAATGLQQRTVETATGYMLQTLSLQWDGPFKDYYHSLARHLYHHVFRDGEDVTDGWCGGKDTLADSGHKTTADGPLGRTQYENILGTLTRAITNLRQVFSGIHDNEINRTVHSLFERGFPDGNEPRNKPWDLLTLSQRVESIVEALEARKQFMPAEWYNRISAAAFNANRLDDSRVKFFDIIASFDNNILAYYAKILEEQHGFEQAEAAQYVRKLFDQQRGDISVFIGVFAVLDKQAHQQRQEGNLSALEPKQAFDAADRIYKELLVTRTYRPEVLEAEIARNIASYRALSELAASSAKLRDQLAGRTSEAECLASVATPWGAKRAVALDGRIEPKNPNKTPSAWQDKTSLAAWTYYFEHRDTTKIPRSFEDFKLPEAGKMAGDEVAKIHAMARKYWESNDYHYKSLALYHDDKGLYRLITEIKARRLLSMDRAEGMTPFALECSKVLTNIGAIRSISGNPFTGYSFRALNPATSSWCYEEPHSTKAWNFYLKHRDHSRRPNMTRFDFINQTQNVEAQKALECYWDERKYSETEAPRPGFLIKYTETSAALTLQEARSEREEKTAQAKAASSKLRA